VSQTYVQRRRAAEPAAPAEKAEAAPRAFPAGPVSPAQPGKPLVLSEAIRAKMENAFGADLSAVRLYENPAVAEAGARAVAQGSRIAFAPGSADFHTRTGQALLGHELSHVLSQARGEVSGRGLLVDRSLEARADREGELAAAGETVYDGPVAGALTDASAASAAGPMQAQKDRDKELDQMAASLAASRNAPAAGPAPVAAHDAAAPVAGSNPNETTTTTTTTSSVAALPASGGNEADARQDQTAGMSASDAARYRALLQRRQQRSVPSRRRGAATRSQLERDFGLANRGIGVAKQSSSIIGKAAQFGEILDKTDEAFSARVFNAFSGGFSGLSGFFGGLIGAGTGLAATLRNSKNVALGTSRTDAAISGIDAINSFGSSTAGAAQIAGSAGAAVGDLVPGLAMATGLISIGTGAVQAGRGLRGNNNLSGMLHELNAKDPATLSDDQTRLRQIFAQGKQVTGRNAITGTLKAGAGLMGVTAGALGLSAVASPLALVAGGLGAATGLGSFIYERIKNAKIRHSVIDDELGGLQQVRAQFPNMKLSDREARRILLKSHGYKDTRDAYRQITQKRATDLYNIAAHSNDPEAKAMAERAMLSLGIKKRGLRHHEEFQDGAAALLAGKLL